MNAIHTDAWITTPGRELTSVEVALLRYLLEREAPQHVSELGALKVVGQCSCGGCPTVIFQEPGISLSQFEVALYADATQPV